MITLTAIGLSKSYGSRHVIRSINVSCTSGDIVGIVGPNGSGKSTLLRMLSGTLRPDTGHVQIAIDGDVVPSADLHRHIGVVAPYLQIYDEFTAQELLTLQRRLRGDHRPSATIQSTLESVGLHDRSTDTIRTLSSGLRQRVLIALAIDHEPAVLLLDEPTITLDASGQELVRHHVVTHHKRGGVLCIATNDSTERSWCTREIAVAT